METKTWVDRLHPAVGFPLLVVAFILMGHFLPWITPTVVLAYGLGWAWGRFLGPNGSR